MIRAQHPRRRAFGALFSLALVATACGSGGSDDSAGGDGKIVDANAQQAAQDAIQNTTTTGAAAASADAPAAITSMDDYEKLWASQRQTIIDDIKANGWGWDQTAQKVTGPGFEVDLTKCGAGWDPYGGLDDEVIKIGQTIPASGIAADWTNAGFAEGVYYDWINGQGGIKDVTGKTYTITSDRRDDSYDPAKTVPLVDELLDSEGSFMIKTTGSPNTLKVYEKLNSRCVPNPYVISGHPAWGDPVNHPWTWGNLMAYNTEAVLWGNLITSRLADQDEITVAALIMQNDFGQAYEVGFKNFMATSDKKINFVFERVDPAAVVVTSQMTTLEAAKPDAFIAMTGGTPCTQAILEAANNGMKETAKMLFMPSVCKAMTYVGKDAVGGDGSTADGWLIVGGGVKDFNDSALLDDPWVAFARKLLTDAGKAPESSGLLNMGFDHSWPVVESLKIAAELPGGISRPNFMLAARVLDMTNPNLLDGVKYNMKGAEDPYPTEGSDISQFDAAKQSWVVDPAIGIIELSGKSSPCHWDLSSSSCR